MLNRKRAQYSGRMFNLMGTPQPIHGIMDWREADYGAATITSTDRLDCVKFEEPVWVKEIRVTTTSLPSNRSTRGEGGEGWWSV